MLGNKLQALLDSFASLQIESTQHFDGLQYWMIACALDTLQLVSLS